MNVNRRQFVGLSAALAMAGCSHSALAVEGANVHEGQQESDADAYIPQTPEEARHPALASASTAPVGSAVVLVIDSSDSSKENDSFGLQLKAHARALMADGEKPSAVAEVLRLTSSSVAFCVVMFSATATTAVRWVDFRHDDPALDQKFDAFGKEILALKKWQSTQTFISSSLDTGEKLLDVCPWQPSRRTIDVSSDGTCDSGPRYLRRKSDELAKKGITINGLAIEGWDMTVLQIDLKDYYDQYLITQKEETAPDGVTSTLGTAWQLAQMQGSALVSNEDVMTLALRRKLMVDMAGLEQGSYLARYALSEPERDLLEHYAPGPVPSRLSV